jgi:hypothetical protein
MPLPKNKETTNQATDFWKGKIYKSTTNPWMKKGLYL